MNFNHRFGCAKCLVIGEFDINSHRMSFPNIDAERRTDTMFRNREQLEPVCGVRRFGHQHDNYISNQRLHLGVMKKCLVRWIFGEKGYNRKWKNSVTDRISRLLINCNANMPSDIHRSVRTLKTLKYWKGVEFRSILLYIGMIVLREALNETEYLHFLTLSCAVRISSCSFYRKYLSIAEKMYRTYVNNYIEIYGRSTITSNVHNLIHICEEIEQLNMKNLDIINTYRFENCLRLLGMRVKHCNLPLEQISRRILESFEVENAFDLDHSEFSSFVLGKKKNENFECYEKNFIKPDVMLASKKYGDQWFLTRNNDIVKMKFAIKMGNVFKIVGNKVNLKEAFFTKPINSTILHIYASSGDIDTENHQFNLNEIFAKLICLQLNQRFVYMPILHTLENLNE